MNLSQLYYFVRMAELENYTKASKELFITQPSLSAAISSLESELGLSLFQKKGRNVVLTKYGEEFYVSVSQSLNELERGIANMKAHSGKLDGVVNVGCIPTLLGSFLPNIIKQFKNEYTDVKMNVFQGMSLDIAESVALGKYDIGFCSKVEAEDELYFIPIMAQEIILIVNENHELAKRTEISIKEVRDFKVLTYRAELPIGKTVRNLLNKYNINASYAYDDEISIGGEVSETNVAAIVAKTSSLKQFDNIVKIPITDIPKDTRLIYMVFRKNSYISSSISAFADYVVAHKLDLPTKDLPKVN